MYETFYAVGYNSGNTIGVLDLKPLVYDEALAIATMKSIDFGRPYYVLQAIRLVSGTHITKLKKEGE